MFGRVPRSFLRTRHGDHLARRHSRELRLIARELLVYHSPNAEILLFHVGRCAHLLTYAGDYNAAAMILADSPKASAALSRRCLQHVLQHELNITKRNLADEIDEAIKILPSYVGDGLDEVRKIGNFAAHPKKSDASGEVLEVEPGEAEWSLDVLDMLFDHVFVAPAKKAARRAALDAKLSPSGTL